MLIKIWATHIACRTTLPRYPRHYSISEVPALLYNTNNIIDFVFTEF